uniref:Death domain-containing protein n=1 Tax=Amphimedon queenslandica TaxID=400682 RepID=A0A1X7SSX5_AMPQE
MELCQKFGDPSFLKMTNLIAGDIEETGDSTSETQRRGERLLFFPCLLSTDRPKKMTSQVYQFGWCLQCTREHDFFPPRYFHVLSLHLAFKMAQPQEDDKLKRRCTFWKNGLYWFNGHGVESLVEIVDESQWVLVMMSCEKGYSDNMVSLRRDVIGEVMSVYKESCPSLEVKELVIDPKELAYPVNTPRERTVYSVKDILSAINKGEEFLVKSDGTKGKKVKEILPDESLSDISNLSLLGGKGDGGVKCNNDKDKGTTTNTLNESQEHGSTSIEKGQIRPTQISESNDDQQKAILTIKNLVEVKQLLKDDNFQTTKWFDLGLYLGLSYNDLKTIETNYPRDTEQCLTECLAKWLKDDIEATWDKLAIAAGKAIDKREDNLSLLGGKGDGGVKYNNNKDKGTTTNTLNESQEHGSTSEKGQSDIDVLKINDEVQEAQTDKLLGKTKRVCIIN